MADTNGSRPVCGLIMPISAIDGVSENHWTESDQSCPRRLNRLGLNRTSSAPLRMWALFKNGSSKTYRNPIVVCDVSGKNPNVMFELGLRLAFDKPTIIVKDDKTSYSFDTSPIEHLEYPRDLRFGKIVEFKEKLADKICKTHEKSKNDPTY